MSDGWRSSPAKSSKSEPFAIVTTGPFGERSRISPAIASDTHVIASAWLATSLATACSPCSFARTISFSALRCGCATIESRRSATHLTPVAFFTAAPIRCTDEGGDVVITTSMPSLRTIRIAAGIAVRFQLTFSSGTRKRRPNSCACFEMRTSPCVPCSSSAGFRPRGPT